MMMIIISDDHQHPGLSSCRRALSCPAALPPPSPAPATWLPPASQAVTPQILVCHGVSNVVARDRNG
eukprot:2791087-Rhodomonas_salina.1